MKTIYINDEDCFLRVEPDMMATINVPKEPPENEIPFHSMYIVALAHLIAEENVMLDELVKEKWNELVDFYKHVKGEH